jgi:hypothetical protein
MEEMAFSVFQAKVITELSVKVGAFEITDDEYYYGSYIFIANLSPAQIKLLEKEKVYMKLWSPVGEPDFTDLMIT